MFAIKVKMAQGGRVMVPAEMRRALGMEIGDELLMKVENQELKIFNLQHAINEAQNIMARYNPQKKCLSDEIIKDRRDEA